MSSAEDATHGTDAPMTSVGGDVYDDNDADAAGFTSTLQRTLSTTVPNGASVPAVRVSATKRDGSFEILNRMPHAARNGNTPLYPDSQRNRMIIMASMLYETLDVVLMSYDDRAYRTITVSPPFLPVSSFPDGDEEYALISTAEMPPVPASLAGDRVSAVGSARRWLVSRTTFMVDDMTMRVMALAGNMFPLIARAPKGASAEGHAFYMHGWRCSAWRSDDDAELEAARAGLIGDILRDSAAWLRAYEQAHEADLALMDARDPVRKALVDTILNAHRTEAVRDQAASLVRAAKPLTGSQKRREDKQRRDERRLNAAFNPHANSVDVVVDSAGQALAEMTLDGSAAATATSNDDDDADRELAVDVAESCITTDSDITTAETTLAD